MVTNPRPESAGQRWRDALAELEYAERHGAAPDEMERLSANVIEARVAMFQAEVNGGRQFPEFVKKAFDRDCELLGIKQARDTSSPPDSLP